MASALLENLTAASTLAASDLFYVKQAGARGLKATGTQLLALVGTTYVPLAGGTMTGPLTLPAGTDGSPTLDFTGSGIFKNYANTLSISAGGSERLLVTADAVHSTAPLLSVYPDSAALAFGAASDIKLYRDAAATLAQRNGTTQQIFRLYNSYTDSSNFERLTLTGVAGTSVNITAETLGTGADNLDIVLTPAGTGRVYVPVGATATPGLCFTGTDVGFWYENFVLQCRGQNFGMVNFVVGNTTFKLAGTQIFGWAVGDAYATAFDTAFSLNSSGVVEVNNGTAGTYRDLKLRNLLSTGYATIDSGTLTASAPALNITQTWNNAGVTFEGIVLDVVNTASSSPLFLNLKVSGTSKWRVNYLGQMVSAASILGTTSLDFYSPGLRLPSGSDVSWTSGAVSGTADLILARDAAATLAQRNGVNPQTFNLYNTYTDVSNYERGFFRFASNVLELGFEAAGTGTSRDLKIRSTNVIRLQALQHAFNTSGGVHSITLKPLTDGSFNWQNNAGNDFGLMGFGGATASYPALKRSTTTLEVRLADDSSYTDLKLRNLLNTEYHQMTEMTAPAAPATNSVRIYAEDNGAGKTRLMALFATGAAQQIAIEP